MAKRHKLEIQVTAETTLSLSNDGTVTVEQFAGTNGIPLEAAIKTVEHWLDDGVAEAKAQVTIIWIKGENASQTAPARQPRRRRTKAEMEAARAQTASIAPINKSSAAPAKRPVAELAEEMTWDARVRAYAVMGQPWGHEWGPPPDSNACRCPEEILKRYGIAA